MDCKERLWVYESQTKLALFDKELTFKQNLTLNNLEDPHYSLGTLGEKAMGQKGLPM